MTQTAIAGYTYDDPTLPPSPVTAEHLETPLLANTGHDDHDVDAVYQAWCKAVTLQIALWSQPYAGAGW